MSHVRKDWTDFNNISKISFTCTWLARWLSPISSFRGLWCRLECRWPFDPHTCVLDHLSNIPPSSQQSSSLFGREGGLRTGYHILDVNGAWLIIHTSIMFHLSAHTTPVSLTPGQTICRHNKHSSVRLHLSMIAPGPANPHSGQTVLRTGLRSANIFLLTLSQTLLNKKCWNLCHLE